MLELRDIVKTYESGDSTVRALDGVSLCFRENEFVSILGASGCGKTTMLNIVGGLDRYTSGDLIINGKSTKLFKDSDWDSYRNHSIGFVFQSYNLIPHQSVLSNVELALTLSGVSKAERRKRAAEALEKVGLGDQLHKKPNQMSGGQMQRVAIARALVNNPDILLADEPTGALDTHTSVQIMELLKEVASDRLVIMVTHNPELAEEYSSRIVRLSDGRVIDDTNPLSQEEYNTYCEKQTAAAIEAKKEKKAKKAEAKSQKTSMSFFTALSLSLNNLLTKKGRTVLTSFAGSIGIIGIALILSLSTGINAYIEQVQEDTLSTYPLSIQKETQDFSAMLSAMTEVQDTADYSNSNQIHVDDSLGTMMAAMSATVENNLEAFKKYLDENYDKIEGSVSDIQYTYDFDLQIFTSDGKTQVSPTTIFKNMGESFASMGEMMEASGMNMGFGVMSEMIDNQELLNQQYDVIAGEWANEPNEVVLVVNKNNQISKMTLYMLGVLDQGELEDIMKALMTNGEYDTTPLEPYDYDYFLNMTFRLLNTSDFYEKTDKTYEGGHYVWRDIRDLPGYDQEKFVTENGTELKITGIIRPKAGVAATSISGAIGYTKGLTDMILDLNTKSEVINQQKATPDYNILTGLKFERTHYTPETIVDLINKIDSATMEMFYAYMTEQIKTNPELSGQVQVNSPQTFMGMFMLMPEDIQMPIFESILNKALEEEAKLGLSAQFCPTNILCGYISTMLGVQVTPQNIMTLYPILDTKTQVLLMLNGIPASEQMPQAIPGLMELAGDDFMSGMYTELEKTMLTLTVNKEIFLTLLSTMDENSDNFKMIEETLYNMAPQIDATLDSTLELLGDAEKAKPASINFYAKDFESKETIEAFIADYNNTVEEIDKIQYTDLVGVMMSSVTTIINVISYVLIAFVSISLVVSSIMIGIITYISVLERTKEIGILRAIGASKGDISRVFNAETLIVGFAAGLIGVLGTVALILPINAIIQGLSGIANIRAILPWGAAIILVAISMFLTFIAGLIPAKVASKKDPVVALRSE